MVAKPKEPELEVDEDELEDPPETLTDLLAELGVFVKETIEDPSYTKLPKKRKDSIKLMLINAYKTFTKTDKFDVDLQFFANENKTYYNNAQKLIKHAAEAQDKKEEMEQIVIDKYAERVAGARSELTEERFTELALKMNTIVTEWEKLLQQVGDEITALEKLGKEQEDKMKRYKRLRKWCVRGAIVIGCAFAAVVVGAVIAGAPVWTMMAALATAASSAFGIALTRELTKWTVKLQEVVDGWKKIGAQAEGVFKSTEMIVAHLKGFKDSIQKANTAADDGIIPAFALIKQRHMDNRKDSGNSLQDPTSVEGVIESLRTLVAEEDGKPLQVLLKAYTTKRDHALDTHDKVSNWTVAIQAAQTEYWKLCDKMGVMLHKEIEKE